MSGSDGGRAGGSGGGRRSESRSGSDGGCRGRTGPPDEGVAALIAGHPPPPLLADGSDPGLVAWRAGLPGLVAELLERWGLRAGAPFLPGGSSAWVAPVHDGDGAERVLKVAWAHEESRDEAAGMAAWQGLGAARLHRHERHGETAALLLDRVSPGTPLAELLTWPERDEVVAAVATRLWRPPEELVGFDAAAGFRSLSSMCAGWADSARRRAEGRAGRPAEGRAASRTSPLPRSLIDDGLRLFRDLPLQWDGEAVLLATDLHPGNVLASTDAGSGSSADTAGRRWVLIDPKPYVGDPHYDLLQHMLNDPVRLRDQPAAFADRMAALAGLDPHRMRRWLLARCVQESWGMEAAAEAAVRLADDGIR